MVVLEGHNMLGVNNPNQYLQPDYLSPLPTTLDSKKSPLALLVQTCSQIGADPPTSSKSLLHPSPLSSTDSNSSLSSSGSSGAQKRKASTDSGHGMSLKSHSSDSSSNDSGRPRSSGSTSSSCSAAKQPRLSHSTSPPSHHVMVNGKVSPSNKYSSASNNNNESSMSHQSSKSRKLSGQSVSSECSEKNRNLPSRSSPPTSHSASVVVPQGKHSSGSSASHGTRSPHGQQQQNEKSTKSESGSVSTKSSSHSSPKPSSHQHDQGASPIIRSGLDVLQGKDLPKFGAFGAYPGFDPTNPAFRLPFLAAHHANLLAGYPPGAIPSHPAAAAQYAALYGAGIKPKESPICRDPYCTGCQFSGPSPVSSTPSSSSFVCPAGCATCDHPKFPLLHPSAAAGSTGSPYPSIPGFPPGMSHAALSALGATYPPSVLSHSHHAAAAAALIQQQAMATLASHQQSSATAKPYVCNWNSEKGYCGVRFQNSEDLLVHLRQHTSSSANSSSSSSVENASSSAVGTPFASGHPGIPHPPTSTAASIYSAAMAAAMHRAYPTPPPASPYLSALAAAGGKSLGPIPPPPAALAGYYSSPYSLYGPRIG